MEKLEPCAPCWCGSGKAYKDCHCAFDEKYESLRRRGAHLPPRKLIKNEAQIEKIRRSAKVNVAVLDYVAEHICPGISTEEIDRWVYEQTAQAGAIPAPLNYEGFPKSVCTSINEQVCHGIPSPEDILCEGDIVNVTIEDVQGASHLAGENRTVFLNGQQLPAELQAGIVGMKKGETKDVEWTHSHEHDGETLSHDFKVKVTLNAIKVAVVPELSDELVKKSFGYDDVDAFKAAVKEEIEGDKKHTLPELKEDRVVEAMGKQVKLDEVPENYKNEIFNELAQEFLGQLQRQNISLDMFLRARGVKSEDFIADLHAQADERARQSLALDAVAEKLGLEASDEDVDNEFARAGIEDVKSTVAQWKKDGRLPAIRDSIKRTKALDWLVENAKVTVKDEVAERAAEAEAADAE